MSETKFRRYFRDLLREHGVWTAAVEHRSGGSFGMCDLCVQLGEGLIPVELKLGEWRLSTAKLHCSRIRPTQIGFLDGAYRSGVSARLVIGVPQDYAWVGKHWRAYLLRNVSRERLSMWRSGFDMDELVCVVDRAKLVLPVTQW